MGSRGEGSFYRAFCENFALNFMANCIEGGKWTRGYGVFTRNFRIEGVNPGVAIFSALCAHTPPPHTNIFHRSPKVSPPKTSFDEDV